MGFAYQLGFVQVFQRFPVQQPARAAKSRAAPDFPFDPDLLPHVSPIEWNNVILYGEIKIDPAKIKLRVPWRLFLHESGRYPTLQQWGGPDAAFKRMNELATQLSPEEEVPKEVATATVTSPIDSHSIWHSIRLTGIDFESLNWGQIDLLGRQRLRQTFRQTQRGVCRAFDPMSVAPRQRPNLLCLRLLQHRSQSRGAVLGLNGW